MNIYVGNLHYNTSEANLRELFGEFGEVTSAKIITDKMSGRSKGFGFVEMTIDSEAEKAINELNGLEFDGRTITVNESIERKDAPKREFRRDNRRDFNRRDNNFRSNR